MNRVAKLLVVLPAIWYFNVYNNVGQMQQQLQFPTAKECTTQANDFAQVFQILHSDFTVSVCQRGDTPQDIFN